MTNNRPVTGRAAGITQKALRILLCATAVIVIFCIYTWGITQNPPGFCLDESATAYNAYLVSQPGLANLARGFL
jgi:hypothetical protein